MRPWDCWWASCSKWLLIGDYACDYECFVNAIDWTFFFFLAVYEATPYLIDGIDWYRHSFTTCPGAPVDWSSWPGDGAALSEGGNCLATLARGH